MGTDQGTSYVHTGINTRFLDWLYKKSSHFEIWLGYTPNYLSLTTATQAAQIESASNDAEGASIADQHEGDNFEFSTGKQFEFTRMHIVYINKNLISQVHPSSMYTFMWAHLSWH